MTARLALGYVAIFAISAALASTSFVLGSHRHPQPKVAGIYSAQSPCIGSSQQFKLEQSGQFVDASGGISGALRFRHGTLTGTARCSDGSRLHLALKRVAGQRLELRGAIDAVFIRDLPKPGSVAVSAGTHSNEQIFGRLMLAIAIVILAARLVRFAVGKVGQPPVMGEVLAGILLGPTLLGAVAPSVKNYLFPAFVIPLLNGAADIGLAFYLFLVGLELDPRMLKGRISHAAAISNTSVIFPLGVGIAVALPLYTLLGTPNKTFQAFALFMGVALSVTAFPVLARILIERRMLARPIGALALSAAAVDDVTAWGLLAIASGIAGHGSAFGVLPVLGYVFAFCLGMAFLARPLLARVSAAYDEAGHVPSGWISAIFVGVLLSAFLTQKSGIAPIFGAFVFGLVMPRRADLSHDVTRRLEDFVATVLLPLFFVVTGLRTDVGLLNRPVLWGLTLVIIAVAIVGKGLAATAIARVAGYGLRESAVLGALMNTRGLTELIVLNIGLELGVISQALFTMLVIMALVTTFMTAPLIRVLDPRRLLSAPVEEELPAPEAERAILVAALDEENIDELLAVSEPLARSDPPRELILVRPLEPPRVTGPIATRERELDRANQVLARVRATLVARGVDSSTAAFTSGNRGADLARLAAEQRIDLLVVDGRRPLLGAGVPAGEVGAVLAGAPCDVAVLVDQERAPVIDADHPVYVALGGGPHDAAALELGTCIASGTGAPLHQVDIAETARGAGLLVVGMPDLWQRRGLGRVRGALAGSTSIPTLFVRRGEGR